MKKNLLSFMCLLSAVGLVKAQTNAKPSERAVAIS